MPLASDRLRSTEEFQHPVAHGRAHAERGAYPPLRLHQGFVADARPQVALLFGKCPALRIQTPSWRHLQRAGVVTIVTRGRQQQQIGAGVGAAGVEERVRRARCARARKMQSSARARCTAR